MGNRYNKKPGKIYPDKQVGEMKFITLNKIFDLAKDHIPYTRTTISKIIFLLTVFTSVFWITGNRINIYSSALTGAIFEMLWLPCVAMAFVLPALSLLFLVKEKFNRRSLYLYTILITIMTVLVIKCKIVDGS